MAQGTESRGNFVQRHARELAAAAVVAVGGVVYADGVVRWDNNGRNLKDIDSKIGLTHMESEALKKPHIDDRLRAAGQISSTGLVTVFAVGVIYSIGRKEDKVTMELSSESEVS